jgi:hypothetical protein
MYPEDLGSTDGKTPTSDKAFNKKKSKLTKNAKPPAVTKDGSYWRMIDTYFLQPMHPWDHQEANITTPNQVELRKNEMLVEETKGCKLVSL